MSRWSIGVVCALLGALVADEAGMLAKEAAPVVLNVHTSKTVTRS